MRGLVFPLALLLVAACGSSSKKSDAKASGSSTASADGSYLLAVYEVREQDGGAQVGTVYKRQYSDDRVLYWVDDMRGTRLGYVTEDNRAFAFEVVMGKRSDVAYPIGEDTISACTRMVLGHNRAVMLEQIDLDTWARKGTVHEQAKPASKPEADEPDAEADE